MQPIKMINVISVMFSYTVSYGLAAFNCVAFGMRPRHIEDMR